MPSWSRVRFAGRCDCSTILMISSFSDAGYPLTPSALRKPFDKALVDAKISGFRLHDLRHTQGTRIVRETGSIAAAKEALKHRSVTTTLRYAHVMDDDVRIALDASELRNSHEAKTIVSQ